MTSSPASLIIMIVLAAFVIDRLVTASLFLLAFIPAWAQRFPDPLIIEDAAARRVGDRRQKLIYFVLAGVLAAAFLSYYRSVGVLAALKFDSDAALTGSKSGADPTATPPATGNVVVASPSPDPAKGTTTKPRTSGDFILTWLILVGGAENIAKLLRGYGDPGGGGKSESQPIEITGKLTLEDRSEKKS